MEAMLIMRLVDRLDRLERLKAVDAPKVIVEREMLLIWKAKEALKPPLRELGYIFHGDEESDLS